MADAAIRRDPEWIPNISDVWTSGKSSRKLVNDFIDQLAAKAELSDDEEELIAHSLDRLFDLQKYPFTALEIAPRSMKNKWRDIFVRINSEGVKLNQADLFLPCCRSSGTKAEQLWSAFVAPRAKPWDRICSLAVQSLYPAGPGPVVARLYCLGFGRGR